MLTSKLCNYEDFSTDWFQRWAGPPAVQPHRKSWEFAVVTQALYERGVLKPGMTGIGFAVGQEPLPGRFASLGCKVIATDNAAGESVWAGQFSGSKFSLHCPDYCSPEDFERNVEFRQIDMKALPLGISGLDFSWSCCAVEHLGTLDEGLKFLIGQMSYLRPGGWSAHTLEYNTSSDDKTISTGPTVLYRRRDIQDFVWLAEHFGCRVEEVNYSLGSTPQDLFVATPPIGIPEDLAHLRLRIGAFVCTSLLLLIQRL